MPRSPSATAQALALTNMKWHHLLRVYAALFPMLVLAGEDQFRAYTERLLAATDFALTPTGTVVEAKWRDTNILFRAEWWYRADYLHAREVLVDALAGGTDLWNPDVEPHHSFEFMMFESGQAGLGENTLMRVRTLWRGQLPPGIRQRLVQAFDSELPTHALQPPIPKDSIRVVVETRHPQGQLINHFYLPNDRKLYEILSSVGVEQMRSQHHAAGDAE